MLQLAIIANEQTPYRLHLHRRIAQEIPEVQLWSLFTHELASSPWKYREEPPVRSVLFGKGDFSGSVGTLTGFIGEWRKGGQIIRWLERHGTQAVVLFGYNDAARLRIVRWAAAESIPCFVFGDSSINNDRAKGLRSLIKRGYVPWILGQTTGVFYCGRLGKEYFMRYNVPQEKLYPFPYEPDYSLFRRQPAAERVETIQRFGLNGKRHRLLFVGRMIDAKRPDLLLSAFEAIAAERPDWDLVMVGDGPLCAGLQERSSHLRTRLHWLGFISDPGAIAALYAACDVFVLPSDFEPWGVVLTEAAGSLALVASSAVGAAADVIEDGVNGRIFQKGDAVALRDTLLEVTSVDRLNSMQAASPSILARWREAADPVRNLRRALQDVDLLIGGGDCLRHAG